MSGLLNVGVNFVELRYEQLGRKLKQERSQNERWRLKKQLRIVGRNGTLVDVLCVAEYFVAVFRLGIRIKALIISNECFVLL